MAAHLYWRLWILSVHNPTDNMCGILDIKMRLTTGGADQCTGGTPFSSPYEGFNEPSQAFENNEGSWFSDPLESFPVHIGYEFASTKDIVEFTVRADFDHPEYAPATFIFQYSDDGVAWESQAIYYPAAFSSGETKTFSVTTPTTYELLRKIQYDLDALFAIELRRSIQYDLVAPTTFELLRRVKYHLDASQNTLELRRQIAYAIEVPIVFELRRKIKYDLNGVNTFELKRHITYDLAVPFTSYLYHKTAYDFLAPITFEKRSRVQYSLQGNAIWTPVITAVHYELTLTGENDDLPDAVLPISSFSVYLRHASLVWREQIGVFTNPSYISAYVPYTAEYAQAVADRPNGELVIKRGNRWTDGRTELAEIIRSPLDSVRTDIGGNSGTISLSGYWYIWDIVPKEVTLNNVTFKGSIGDSRRFWVELNTALMPSDTGIIDGESIQIWQINYTVSERQGYMEVVG